MPGFDPRNVSTEHWMYARALFDNYDLGTIQSIFEHLSSTQRRGSTVSFQTISSGASTSYTRSSGSSILSDRSRISTDSGLSLSGFVTSVPNAINNKVKSARGTSRPSYPCFCTFHHERGDPLIINRKSDWKRHENNYHNSNEIWRCLACTETCPSFEALQGHYKKKHNKTLSKNEVAGVHFLPRQRYACGFVDCELNGLLNNWDKRCNHVADHMKDNAQLEEKDQMELKWSFSVRLVRLLRQPEIHQHWTDFMTSNNGPNEANWPKYWKLNDLTSTLVHKLECRDFRPSPEAIAKCACYLAWASAGSNAPNVARFKDFIQSVLKPPTDPLPTLRTRTSQDLDRELKRIPEAELLSASFHPGPQLNTTSPSATSVGIEEEPSSQEISMIDSPLDPQTSQPFGVIGFHFTPTTNYPHPGNQWVQDQEDLSIYSLDMQSDSLDIQPIELNALSQDNAMGTSCFDNGSTTAQQHRHRTPGQFLRSMTSSLALSHRRSPPR